MAAPYPNNCQILGLKPMTSVRRSERYVTVMPPCSAPKSPSHPPQSLTSVNLNDIFGAIPRGISIPRGFKRRIAVSTVGSSYR